MKIKILILALMLVFPYISNADFIGSSNLQSGSFITVDPQLDYLTGSQLSPSHTYTMTVTSSNNFTSSVLHDAIYAMSDGVDAYILISYLSSNIPVTYPANITGAYIVWKAVSIESVPDSITKVYKSMSTNTQKVINSNTAVQTVMQATPVQISQVVSMALGAVASFLMLWTIQRKL